MSIAEEDLSFRERLVQRFDRDELLDILKEQDPELRKQVRRIEWVFENKLRHLNWADGSQVTERPLTSEEIALLIDEPFTPDPELSRMGLSVEQQHQVHIAKDPVLWARHFLKASPRAYQVMMLRHPSLRKVLRSGRRLGKTFTMAIFLLHYAYTHKNGRCLVVAPMKSHVELIYQEMLRLANEGPVKDAFTRAVTSPQFVIELSNGSTIRFFTSGMKCLTPDHEVLSRDNGWKAISEVNEGEVIAAYDEGRLSWDAIENVWEYDYEGEMISHQGRQISFVATPNHRFLAQNRSENGEWSVVQAQDLKLYKIPCAGLPTPSGRCDFKDEELELWGWWLSEGSGIINNRTRFSQKKAYGVERIPYLIKSLGYDYLHYTDKLGRHEFRTYWKPPIFSGTKCYDKFIPRELLEQDNVIHLLNGLVAGDGTDEGNGWTYSSSSLQLAEGVNELGLRLGYRVRLRERQVSSANPHWFVSGYEYKYSYTNPQLLEKVPYSGKVHCVTVPSGFFFVRHNGLVHVTGNSAGKADVARGQEAHVIVLDELDYMAPEDLDSLYAMLQKTSENQEDKVLMGASTPTGQRQHFWQWCNSARFKEFWFPSYVNPFFSRDTEEEFRDQYTEMAYRHEIEADWGEDVEGVYPRKRVDIAFNQADWKYIDRPQSARSFYLMGVDWDKYGAGVNLVILEVCNPDYEENAFQGKIRVAYRQEIKKEEYTLTYSVDRIIELNATFNPAWIYVDRGYGETQVEILHKYGVDHPSSLLKKKVIGVSFSEMIEMNDPYTKLPTKKEVKPFMIDNLVGMLEREEILFPTSDQDLYLQLISYVVARTSIYGRPVFETSGAIPDHAHDALILACLAYTQKYGDLMKLRLARRGYSVSNEAFLPTLEIDSARDAEIARETWGSPTAAPVKFNRAMALRKANLGRPIRRSSF